MDDDQANWEITQFSLPKAFWIALWYVQTGMCKQKTHNFWEHECEVGSSGGLYADQCV